MAAVLQRLRTMMMARNIAVYVLPRTDEHQSEYLTAADERVRFLTGFSGSNALAAVSQTNAWLWTDGRYLLQAQKELHPSWQLMKMMQGEKKWFEHLSETLPAGSRISFDPKLISAQSGIDRVKYFKEKDMDFIPQQENLVDLVWEDRPLAVKPEIYLHEEWAGRSISEKVGWVREHIKGKKGESAIFNDLSEIAWILNLRSSEIPHNPFFKSILVLGQSTGCLYLPPNHPSLSSPTLASHLSKQNISLQQYPPKFSSNSLITKSQLNYYIYNSIKDSKPIEWQGIGLWRSVRNEKEIAGFRRCHLVDGIAMAKFWSWRSKQIEVDEYVAAMHMDHLRSQQEMNKGLSFDTISGGGPNGAIIHYRPMEGSSSVVTRNMIHLVDSGGQYLDGTTDVTRAFHFGNPTSEEKDAYTRVLLGNLDLERLKWPANVLSGADIDVLARRHLWKKGKDYLHGTGHGVGHFGGVHEGPVGISRLNKTKLQSGMIVTNEPGYYQAGKFGIRIENMLLVRQHEGYNYFQTLTLCPYDRNLIDLRLLTEEDVEHIDRYHKRVWDSLVPHLKQDYGTLQWLSAATAPLLSKAPMPAL